MSDKTEKHPPLVVGIVGGIASGKSLVTQLFKESGASVISADLIAHDVLRMPDMVETLVRTFDCKILTDATMNEAGDLRVIDRKKLGSMVFETTTPSSQREAAMQTAATRRKQLESIVHPRIREIARSELEKMKTTGDANYIIIDAPLLIEGGWLPFCDKVVYIDTPEELRMKFAKARGWTEQEWRSRESAQLSPTEKRAHATDVLVNNNGLNSLQQNFLKLLDSWQTK
jgi:dephospho-CoA kinase